MDEAGTQPAQNPCVSQNGFVVLAKIEKPYTCGSVFRQPWLLIPLFALAGCFLTLCHCFSLDLFAKWACRRSCFLQHARAQRIREVSSATLLRLVAPPEVTAAHRLIARADAVWVPAVVPVLFREPMGGESGDGGYGVTGGRGTGVTGGTGIRWGAKIRRVGWLTRRRGRCPRTPARDSSPLDPRQGGMAPLGTAHLAGA